MAGFGNRQGKGTSGYKGGGGMTKAERESAKRSAFGLPDYELTPLAMRIQKSRSADPTNPQLYKQSAEAANSYGQAQRNLGIILEDTELLKEVTPGSRAARRIEGRMDAVKRQWQARSIPEVIDRIRRDAIRDTR